MENPVIITENYFDALALGEPICINGVYIVLQPDSELKLIDAIENKLVKDYGLDAEE